MKFARQAVIRISKQQFLVICLVIFSAVLLRYFIKKYSFGYCNAQMSFTRYNENEDYMYCTVHADNSVKLPVQTGDDVKNTGL